MERKIPVYLVADKSKGIKADCPIKLREKENKRKALTMLILLDIQRGMPDQEIIDKYQNKII